MSSSGMEAVLDPIRSCVYISSKEAMGMGERWIRVLLETASLSFGGVWGMLVVDTVRDIGSVPEVEDWLWNMWMIVCN